MTPCFCLIWQTCRRSDRSRLSVCPSGRVDGVGARAGPPQCGAPLDPRLPFLDTIETARHEIFCAKNFDFPKTENKKSMFQKYKILKSPKIKEQKIWMILKIHGKEWIPINIPTKEKSPHVLAHMKGSSALITEHGYSVHDIEDEVICQDDVFEMHQTVNEIDSKFTPKRKRSILLSESYNRIGYDSKSSRVASCGTELEFAFEISPDGEVSEKGKLQSANFCKDRLCPMCAWRRSYKIVGQVSRIMDHVGEKYE